MSAPPLPLTSVTMSIQSIAPGPHLVLKGFDLDSGNALEIRVMGDPFASRSALQPAKDARLVLELTLFIVEPTKLD